MSAFAGAPRALTYAEGFTEGTRDAAEGKPSRVPGGYTRGTWADGYAAGYKVGKHLF